MKFSQIFNYKLILGFSNLALTACGLVLLFAGFSLFIDSERILLSRLIGASSDILLNLPHPFFYYVALGLAIAGLFAIFASFIGWWATCLKSYCVLSIYFLVVLSLLLFEFTFCSMVTVWPQCIGLNMDESLMVKVLQSSYGVPGKEQLTAAIDLAQTYFKCCAINSNLNYDMSLWRLQNLGNIDWAVPQTCCMLTNSDVERSYLDPKPLNLTQCQSLLKHEYNRARHSDACFDMLSVWYRQHYLVFLCAGLTIAIVEFFVLVSIVFSCIRMTAKRKRKRVIYRTTGTTMQSNVLAYYVKRPAPQPQAQAQSQPHQQSQQQMQRPSPQSIGENVYVTTNSMGNNDHYAIATTATNRIVDPMKIPNAYSYHMTNSYLV